MTDTLPHFKCDFKQIPKTEARHVITQNVIAGAERTLCYFLIKG